MGCLKRGSLTAALVCGALSGCGQVAAPGVRGAGVISGVVMLGPVTDGSVAIVSPDGTVLASGVTDAQGAYQLSVTAPSGPLRVVVTGGHYTEAASGENVNLPPGDLLSADVLYVSGASMPVSVTALTTIADALSRYLEGTGVAPATAVASANDEVSGAVGFDVIATRPLSIADPSNASATLSPGLGYGLFLAGLSQWTLTAGEAAQSALGLPVLAHVPPYESIDLTDALASDVAADGVLNGVSSQGAVVLGTSVLDTTIERHGFAVAMVDVLSGHGATVQGATTADEAGVPLAAALSFVTAYDLSPSPLFGGVSPVALTEGAVTLVPDPVTPAAPSGWVRGTVSLTGTVTDVFTLPPDPVTIAIDRVAPVAVAVTPAGGDVYRYALMVDTTAYGPDGPHQITESVTDDAGQSATALVSLGFDNTPPRACLNAWQENAVMPTLTGLWSDGTGAGVVSGSFDGAPVTIGPGTWSVTVPALAVWPPPFATDGFPPVPFSLTDAAGNTMLINILSATPWTADVGPVGCPW